MKSEIFRSSFALRYSFFIYVTFLNYQIYRIFVQYAQHMNDKLSYWTDISEYDLETAKAMLVSKRFLYVGFMCHQAIEKLLKAYYVSVKDEMPPYSHNLTYLTEKSSLLSQLSEDQKSFIDELEPLNIEARYPEYKERLLQHLSHKKCKEIISKTELLNTWIRQKLLKK